jgi:hypothetical protein
MSVVNDLRGSFAYVLRDISSLMMKWFLVSLALRPRLLAAHPLVRTLRALTDTEIHKYIRIDIYFSKSQDKPAKTHFKGAQIPNLFARCLGLSLSVR